jgi:hypothetical protein
MNILDNQARVAFISRMYVSFVVVSQLIGCNSGSSPFEYVPVSGRVTYEDGSIIPASGMRLQFEPVNANPVNGMHPRTASTSLDGKGHFTDATSYKFADGLVPGRHKVAIAYATDKDGKLLVPESCTSLSTTELTVDTANLPLEIKVPKP